MNKQNSSEKFLKFNNSFFLLLVLIIISFAYILAIKNGSLISTQGSHVGWFSSTLAATISRMEYNLNGYVGFNKILYFLLNYETINDDILKQARLLKDVDSDGIFTVNTDLGYQNYSLLAFSLFGYSISSLLYLYFTTLIVSVCLYILAFKNNNIYKVILLIFLLSFLLMVPAAERLGVNVAVIYSYRFMTLLAILPLIHICLYALDFNKNINTKNFFSVFSVIVQSLILVSIYHIRSTVIWMFILLFFILFINIFIVIKDNRKAAHQSFKVLLINFAKKSKFIFIVFFIFFIIKIIVAITIDPIYKEKNMGSHIVSHSIYLGLAIHPEIRKVYTDERDINVDEYYDNFCKEKFIKNHYVQGEIIKYHIRKRVCEDLLYSKEIFRYVVTYLAYQDNDQDAYSASFKWLRENGKDEYQLFDINPDEYSNYHSTYSWFKTHGGGELFGPLNNLKSNYSYMKFSFGDAEKILRKVVKSVLVTHPFQVFELTFIIKPIRFLYSYFKYYLKIDIMTLIVTVTTLIYCVFLLRKSSFINIKSFSGILSLIMLFAMIPSIVTYSNPYIIAAQSLILTMCIYYLIAMLLLYLCKKLNIIE